MESLSFRRCLAKWKLIYWSVTILAIFFCPKTVLAYYNEARILDSGTFDTVKELPNMPAAVNDCRSKLFQRECTHLL